jgi:Domain of unknown function (DUF4278)
MKLFCRGNTYDYDPTQTPQRPFQPIERSGAAYRLTCRGTAYTIDPQAVPNPSPNHATTYQLICRGTTYFVHQTAEGATYADVFYGLGQPQAGDLHFV